MGPPAFIVDSSALKDMFEGKKSGGELLSKMNELKNSGVPVKAMTPLASFLRAIWLTDPETKIQSVQKAINFLEIGYSTADFKSEKDTTDEIIRIVQLISKMGKNG
jgi:hypothetical protein